MRKGKGGGSGSIAVTMTISQLLVIVALSIVKERSFGGECKSHRSTLRLTLSSSKKSMMCFAKSPAVTLHLKGWADYAKVQGQGVVKEV